VRIGGSGTLEEIGGIRIRDTVNMFSKLNVPGQPGQILLTLLLAPEVVNGIHHCRTTQTTSADFLKEKTTFFPPKTKGDYSRQKNR
jgi:hypothetical protein